ncbi:MAG TPA: mannose-1-phosphate guanylyltransferase/mannose-6-phosphate isomerase [Gammaproteobacteria bacterium]
MSVLVPVILSGGSGTRLWPLSRSAQPKQFLPLVSARTLFQDTLLRLAGLRGAEVAAPIVVCNEAHRFLVAEQLRELGIAPRAIVLEPVGRNTAPAVGVAALLAAPESLLLVLPADHVIADTAAFRAAVEHALEPAAGGHLVTFGVVPDRPETGYGYLRRGEDRGRWSVLAEFVEKPDRATAEAYVASGRYLWNSGMFLFSAATYLQELERHAPAMTAACRRALAEAAVDADFTRLGPPFHDSPSDSVDYAVMEKTRRAAVVPLDAGWSDVGSWAALHDVLEKDGDGNSLRGDVIARACRDTYVTANGRRVVAIGIEGCVVVETDDAVLVMAKSRSQELKAVVEALEAETRQT